MAVFPSVRRNRLVRASGGGETPVPIPNTAVKAPRGDDTLFKSRGKQRGANRFLQAPGPPIGGRGPFFAPGRRAQGKISLMTTSRRVTDSRFGCHGG